jgi:hypothetical protein
VAKPRIRGVPLSDGLGPDPPRRAKAVGAGMVKAYHVARRIRKACFTPQPRFVAWLLSESKPFGLKLSNRLIKFGALKVHNGWWGLDKRLDSMNRERCVTDSGLEARVVRSVNDKCKPHASVKRDGGRDIDSGKGDLIEFHGA